MRSRAVVLLLMIASVSFAFAPSSNAQDPVGLTAGETAPHAGILLSREAFDALLGEAERSEALDAAMRGWRSAIALAESRAERIEELESELGRGKVIGFIRTVGEGACLFFLGKEVGGER